LWDARSGRKQTMLTARGFRVTRATFNRQENRLVTAEAYPANALRLWNAETGKQIAVLRGHANQASGALQDNCSLPSNCLTNRRIVLQHSGPHKMG